MTIRVTAPLLCRSLVVMVVTAGVSGLLTGCGDPEGTGSIRIDPKAVQRGPIEGGDAPKATGGKFAPIAKETGKSKKKR